MKKLNKKCLLAACLSLSITAGVAGVVAVSPLMAKAQNLGTNEIQMANGASLYLKEVSGLKFTYTVENYDANKNYGMLIVPFDYLDDAGITDLTNTANDYVNALNSANLPYAPIVQEGMKPNEKGEFFLAIADIQEHNYAREFFAIGFEKTGDNAYVYAQQGVVRSVFEVANLALNKLNYGVWGESEEELAEKVKLDEFSGNEDGEENTQDDVLDNFVLKGFNFVYETSTPNLDLDATMVNGEVMPEISNANSKGIDLGIHWNYEVADESIATVVDGKIKGVGRGQTTVTASLGNVISVQETVTVLKDHAELTLYNNSHKANFFAVDGKISLTGGFYNNSTNNTEEVGKDNRGGSVGYVAFEDTYTLDEKGTYIDIYFQGNNMPNVEFFATDVNALFMDGYSDDGKGFIVSNGLSAYTHGSNLKYYYSGYSGYFNYGISAYYARWVGAEKGYLGRAMSTYAGTADKTGSGAAQQYTNFSMYSLANVQDANQNYRYTVGMYLDGNKAYLDAKLYKVNGNEETLFASWENQAILEGTVNSATKSTLSEGEVISGKIVLHAAVKGGADNVTIPTVFTCSKPYTPVSLSNGTNGGAADAITNTVGYVALDGEYGLGTYVDFYFTGSNMPQVSFFNEYVTNNLSATYNGVAETNSGILLINDMRHSTGIVNNAYYRFTVLPRLTKGLANATKYHTDGNNSSSASKISASVLETMPNQRFKYTVGFYLGAGDKIYVFIDVDKLDVNGNKTEDYFDLNQDLSAKLTKADIKGNRIVVYGAVSGNVNATTTFSYSEPYTK